MRRLTRTLLLTTVLLVPVIASAEPPPLPPQGDGCPSSWSQGAASGADDPLTCRCTGEETGSVWGSGVYTADSSICRAARHAGVVGSKGGEVTARATAGCGFYLGSSRNGVETSSWGAYGSSFYFPATGGGVCATLRSGGPCPKAGSMLPETPDDPDAGFRCLCNPDAPQGSVYGTGMFTADSDICTAAIHTGAIGARKGGMVTVRPGGGCSSYAGTTRNGVASQPWGQYARSFWFEGHGQGACTPIKDGGACPSSFQAVPMRPRGVAFRCTCAGGASDSGSIYGTGMYTTDSSICTAAVHAGVITEQKGGMVRVRPGPGCGHYSGTRQNGVLSTGWGPYQASFWFEGHGNGKCPAVTEGGRCPSFTEIPVAQARAGFSCQCPPNASAASVWGTGLYTTDSDICTAAVHVGAIGERKGGMVTVRSAPGCNRYVSSPRNGVESQDWGPYSSSYWFEGWGDWGCPK